MHIRRLVHSLWMVIVLLTTLSGCTTNSSPTPSKNPQSNPLTTAKQEIELSKLMKQPKLLALANGQELYLHSPDLGVSHSIYTFKPEEKPQGSALDTFHLSPNHRWVLWYAPTLGVIALDVIEQQSQILHPPSDFLNTNPFVSFSPTQNLALFITNTGNILRQVDLESLTNLEVVIPYPYGNLFAVSPDEKSILFISGYGQSKQRPQFMYTDIKGKSSRQFTSNTNIADRHWAIWTPDSNGVVMIESDTLQYYPLVNPDEPQPLFSLPDGGKILEVYALGDRIFALSDKDYWHIFSFSLQKEVARTPLSIAHELQNPHFMPWSETEFLIEETLKEGNRQLNRLWLSDFRGSKHMTIDKYQEVIIQTEIESLD